MLLDKLVSPIAWLHYHLSEYREKKVGYKLKLSNLYPNWINATMIFDMKPVWTRFGIKAEGVNYFTIGAIKNGLSTRFDENSPYYQAWFGGYIVKFQNSKAWTINDHFKLGVADQINWLSYYGDKNPMLLFRNLRLKKLAKLRSENTAESFMRAI